LIGRRLFAFQRFPDDASIARRECSNVGERRVYTPQSQELIKSQFPFRCRLAVQAELLARLGPIEVANSLVADADIGQSRTG